MSDLRLQSKLSGVHALKGSWIKAMLIFCVLSLLSFGLSSLDDAYRNVFGISRLTANGFLNVDVRSLIVQAVFTIITFFVMAPLVLGMLEWFWNLTGGTKTGVGDIFEWYGSGRLYAKSLILGLNVGVRCLLWGVLTCGIPLLMIGAANFYSSGVDLSKTNLSATDVQNLLIVGLLMIFGVLILLGGILLFIFITSKYIVAYFLIVEDNSRKVSTVICDSIKYSRKFKWEFTKFILSFTGWFFTCIAILPFLYVIPYFCSSLSVFVKHIIYSQRPRETVTDTIQFNAPEPSK